MIERRNAAFGASGAPVEPERRIRNTPQQFMELRKRVSLTVQHNPVSSVDGIARTGRPPRHRGAHADLWWQRSLRPVAAASAVPATRANAELLPTLMVASAIVLFKLFMLGLLIYSL